MHVVPSDITAVRKGAQQKRRKLKKTHSSHSLLNCVFRVWCSPCRLTSRVPTSLSMIRAKSSWVGVSHVLLFLLCTAVVAVSHLTHAAVRAHAKKKKKNSAKAHSAFSAPLLSPVCVTYAVNGSLHSHFCARWCFLFGCSTDCKTTFQLPAKSLRWEVFLL